MIEIKKAFHPGLIQVLELDQLVNNSLSMKKDERFLLLTGPNMGGKSTLLRQTCLLAILAQLGCYVPCEYYQSIVFDQIFCRIGSSDRIIEGKFVLI
jgi:DNA mismatch repair protein MutS